jgi:hypothetical protein
MNEFITPVNNEALSRVLVALGGEEHAQAVVKAYKVVDEAMAFGYARSQEEEAEKRKVMTEEYVAALQRSEDRDTKEAWEAGYSAGYEEGCRNETATYGDGYIDGVSDARTWPAEADRRVAELCSDEAYDDQRDLDREYDFDDGEFLYDDTSELDERFA